MSRAKHLKSVPQLLVEGTTAALAGDYITAADRAFRTGRRGYNAYWAGKKARQMHSIPGPSMGTRAAPVAISRRIQSRPPKIVPRGSKAKDRSTRISHRELVDDSVPGSTTFTVQSTLHLNPGDSTVFPWLAPQAQQWEQYRVHKLNFEWVPIAPTSTQGDVLLIPDYDAEDDPPATEAEAVANIDSVTDSVWQNIVARLDPEAMMAGSRGLRKFTRNGNVPGDLKTYDVGTFYLATNNETGTTAIGKLYVDYDFEFFVPQDPPGTPSQHKTSSWALSGAQALTNATKATVNFDSSLSVSNLMNFPAPVAGVFTPPRGSYMVHGTLTGLDTSNETVTLQAFMYKNGIQFGQYVPQITLGPGVANNYTTLPFFFPFDLDGTDTVEIKVQMNGAAGTLSLPANRQILFFLVV